jgi:hypothetical protein
VFVQQKVSELSYDVGFSAYREVSTATILLCSKEVALGKVVYF